jgi:hypothetical protein
MFLNRLLNNNEKEYFYLHEEPQIGLYSSCAFLRLSIAIRADEHYAMCRDARIASLSPEFQSKLGWLVGNIFSRVGTTDWKENELKVKVKKILEEHIVWLDEDKIKNTKLSDADINSLSPKELIDIINATQVVKKKDQIIAAILAELQAGAFVRAEDVEAMKGRLGQAQTVAALFK